MSNVKGGKILLAESRRVLRLGLTSVSKVTASKGIAKAVTDEKTYLLITIYSELVSITGSI